MTRRLFLDAIASALLAYPLALRGQPPARRVRIGVLFSGTRVSWTDPIRTLVEGLRERGWIEGQNLVIDFRFADNDYDRLPQLASELVALKPDVLFVGSSPAIRAALKTTSTIPIVFETLGDALGLGFVPNLGRAGTNVAGVSGFSPELSAKLLQYLHEILPSASVVAALTNPQNPATPTVVNAIEQATKRLRVRLVRIDVADPTQLDAAFEKVVQLKPDALISLTDPMLSSQRRRIIQFAARHRLPAAFDGQEHLADGGLLSYGPSRLERFQHAAEYLDRILRGAKPSDLPIARPTKFMLVINVKTAKTLGITIPPPLALRADRLIE